MTHTHVVRGPIALIAVLFAAVLFSSSAFAMTMTGTPPATATVGKYYYWVPSVTGANKATLEFAYVNLPAFSKWYRSSGAIIGTPTEPGVYTNIRIEAGDGVHFVESPPFTITVLPAGSSTSSTLKISGTPAATATVGDYYSFTPTVVAASGSRLSYSISNKPAWATFNSSTGTLAGTPGTSSGASASNIVISVSNGSAKAALPAFAITVDPAPSSTAGSVTLHWVPPTRNTNGTPLTNLAGYLVAYGTSSGALSSQLKLPASATEAEVANLPPGTWYFVVAAINSQNIESQFSSEVSKTVQ